MLDFDEFVQMRLKRQSPVHIRALDKLALS